MSEPDYKFQVSPTINGDMFNIRATSAEEFDENLKGLAERVESIVESLNTIKDAAIIKGVLSSDSGSAGVSGSAAASGSAGSGGPPRCKHGLMKDNTEQAIEKGWKNTHYCPEKNREDQCKPVNLR